MKILGIETSCDETGIAIYDSERGLLADALHSQVKLHAKYGGVVPELASRDHIKRMVPLLKMAFEQADLAVGDVDAVAFTAGPGLLGAVLVGACVGHSLAYAWDVPAVPVHHMEGHLLAPMLEEDKADFPFLALLVSGGHSLLVNVTAFGCYEVLGQSVDDAVGEAFDKTAKMMGLPYPGGALLAKLAEKGDANRFDFPRPMTNRPGLDMSFSGLKTAVLNALQSIEYLTEQDQADIAASFQKAAIDTLVIKCQRALTQTGLTRLVVAGGVSANVYLRQQLSQLPGVDAYFPRPSFCTDNGAMIAYAGYQRLLHGHVGDWSVQTKARWLLSEI